MIYPVVLHKEKNSERLPTRDRLKKCLPQKLRTVFRDIGSAPWWRWLDLPVRPLATVIVAVVFAMSLAVAVPKDEVALLGFLSVISVLWMSSSLSLLDIVGEREVFDHEHHLFLKVRAYLGAKLTSNLILAALQTVVFFATLEIMRQCLLGEISWDAAEKKLPTSLMSGRLLVLMSIPHAAKIDAIPTDPASVVSCLMATGSNARGSHKADNHRRGVGGDCVKFPRARYSMRFQRGINAA